MKASLVRLLALAAVSLLAAGALAQPATSSKPAPVIKPGPGAQPKEAPKAEQPKTDQPKAEVPKGEKSWVELKTSMGTIVIEVDGEKAPISAANFLAYVGEGYYDGTVFHRVISTFMVQGGGFTVSGSNPDVTEKKPTHPPIKNEWQNGLKNKRGTVAMARTPIPDSASSQFFVNVVDNAFLDQDRGDGAGYAVFGKVVSGMDVVDKIKAVKTGYHKLKAGDGGSAKDVRDIPDAPVVIEKARKLSDDEAKKLPKEEPKPAAPETKPSTPAPAPAPAPKPAPTTSPAPAPPKGGGR